MQSPSIYISEEHEMMRETLRRFIENEVIPYGDEWEKQGYVPRDVIKKIGDLGLLGIQYPEKYGGADLDTFSAVLLAEELGRSTFGGFAVTILVHTDMASPHLANAGNEEQLQKYMPAIIAGDIVTAVAVTEPDAGSDVAGLKTRARRDGDDYILNGSKMFITNGVHADLYFVAAKTDSEAKGSRGITMFMLEKGMEGFSVGRELDKTGWRCSDTAELVFDECRVPASHVLGAENMGFYAVMKNFQNERLVLGGMCVGESQKAIDLTLEHLRHRKAFGGVLWDKQAIRHRMAQRQTEVAAARQLLYHAAWQEAQGHESALDVSMVKAYCGELVNRVLYDCVQFHGGMGFMRETPVERMYRDARVQSIGGGATEVMLEEVAKRI